MKTSRHKGGRAKTGTLVKTRDGRFQGIVTLADGSRKRLPPFPAGTSEEMARERVRAASELAIKTGVARTPRKPQSTDTNEDWLRLWLSERESRGLTSVRENASHYQHHILPSIGPKHVKDWSKDDLRRLCRELDAKAKTGAISPKTAWNIWGTATRMCADSAESKLDDLRCRDTNPADGIRGPERGEEAAKAFLYPSELLTFVGCSEVPLEWRRLLALASYTGLRAGELRVLTWPDVDLEHGVIHVHQARDRVTGGVKSTKGRRARLVPIELPIRPMLAAMRAAGEGRGLVVEMPSERDLARGLRRWLNRAGVRRSALHTNSQTARSIRFHDLRGTYCTWLAIQGIDPLKIQQRAGHRDYQTTAGYIATAESVREGFGEVFPVLPDCLVEEQSLHTNRTKSENPGFLRGFWRGGRDSNPPKNSVSAENKLDCGAELLANTAASEAKYPIPGGVIDWRDRSEAAWNTVSRVFGVSP